jgi:tRNA U55 pseudouridine synthase TruB
VAAAFDAFRGDFYQIPPMVSAIKIGGVPLYKMARKGQEVVREPRFVRVFDSEITRVELPEVTFESYAPRGFMFGPMRMTLVKNWAAAHTSVLSAHAVGAFQNAARQSGDL